MNRSLRHAGIAVVVVLLMVVAWSAGDAASVQDRVSLLSAWLSFAFLSGAVSLGPWRAWRGGKPSLNLLVRRDLGIWAALTALAHAVFGTWVVLTPAYFRAYIVGTPDSPTPGWAGWIGTLSIVAGFVLAIIMAMLLALSNNRALTRLGPQRWKRLQRWAVPAFAVTVLHGAVFQVIEGRTGGWLALLALLGVAVWTVRRLGAASTH